MNNLKHISQHLLTKNAQGQVYTIPLAQSEAVLSSISSSQTKCIMLFTSDKNKDGKEWCPYCVNVKPYYGQIYEECKKAGLPLFVFIVGDQPTWKDQNHQFRKNKMLQVTSVPTFGYFNGKKLMNKIGGDDMVQEQQRKLVYQVAKEDQ